MGSVQFWGFDHESDRTGLRADTYDTGIGRSAPSTRSLRSVKRNRLKRHACYLDHGGQRVERNEIPAFTAKDRATMVIDNTCKVVGKPLREPRIAMFHALNLA